MDLLYININGISSLLFIISAIKSWNCYYRFFWWKLFNSTLIIVSYLCNANDYKEPFLLLDHINIQFIALNYIGISFYPNEWICSQISPFLLLFSFIEYQNFKTINFTKNISVVISILKLQNNLYSNLIYYNLLIYSTIIGTISYSLRYKLFTILPKQTKILKVNFNRYYFIIKLTLTTIFHICIMVLLYISSISLNYIPNT
jgi:hypothetical protein